MGYDALLLESKEHHQQQVNQITWSQMHNQKTKQAKPRQANTT